MNNQMTVKDWIVTLLILAIPIVNIIFLLIWAFGKEDSRKNYSRAALIVYSIIIGLSLVIGITATIFDYSLDSSSVDTDYDANYWTYQAEERQEMNNNIEISDVHVKDNGNYKSVAGLIKNNSTTESYSNFDIEFNIYNENNSIIQTVTANIDGTVTPGDVFEFSEGILHIDSFSAKVIDLR
ncbi:Uncharacterised protein [Lysinibacillus sphaericus]|nr:Uncharacterised protein [Lysinibacillus sphaericus]